MKISIIIPVHNGTKTIRACVESFVMQEYQDLEIVLVENNSSDNSLEVCTKLEEQYKNIVCISTNAVGVSAARNEGLKRATGDIIGFADADDTVSENALKKVTWAFDKHPQCDMVVTGLTKIYPDNKVIVKAFSKNKCLSYKKLRRRALYDSRIAGYVWNKFWRRSALEKVKFRTDLSHGEDAHFVMNSLVKESDGKGLVLKDALYNYYQSDVGATALIDKMFDEKGRLKLIVAAQAIIDDFKLDKITYMFVRRLIFSMASSQYLRFKVEGEKKEYLIKNMKKNIWYYLVTGFSAPMETIKRLIRLVEKK